MKKIGVLIVEDSAVVRQLLEHIIGGDPRLQIVGSVPTAEEALTLLPHLSPDVISLDIRLPGMDGLEATRRIMRERPTPIVVCSASVESNELSISMNALRAGALAVVEKPVGTSRADYESIAKTLCTQLAIMSDVRVVRQRAYTDTARASRLHRAGAGSATGLADAPPESDSGAGRSSVDQGPHESRAWRGRLRVVGIGASTGGPPAVVQLLTDLGRDFPLPVTVVQHIIPSFLPGFVSWLNDAIPGRAVIAR
jgi:two-component system chemotaxis response regulator CheB